jgi:hypothetical protein
MTRKGRSLSEMPLREPEADVAVARTSRVPQVTVIEEVSCVDVSALHLRPYGKAGRRALGSITSKLS